MRGHLQTARALSPSHRSVTRKGNFPWRYRYGKFSAGSFSCRVKRAPAFRTQVIAYCSAGQTTTNLILIFTKLRIHNTDFSHLSEYRIFDFYLLKT
jgi:hypothetical protein